MRCERIALRRAVAAAFVFLSVCARGGAAPAPLPLPVAGPTTPQEMEAFVDGFMGAQTPGAIAGATVAVVKDGALFFTKGYGYADIAKQIPVNPARTIFRLGSISKLFTWTAVMQLVEQHKLDLDADVNTYLQEFKIPATHGAPVPLRNIMTHTFREPLPADLAGEASGAYVMRQGMLERQPFEMIHNWAPAGSGSSVATDVAKFMLAYLQEGGTGGGRILRPETVRLMFTRALSPDPALDGLLLGFYETRINSRRVIGHGGDTLYFHSVIGLLLEAHLGLYVSINTGGQSALMPYALERAFFQHYFPAKLPQVRPPADAVSRNERYAGTYRTLRHSYTKFEKILSAFGDIHAVPMSDGTLAMGDPVFHTPARWVEVGDGVFRKIDEDVFIAFKGNDGGPSTGIVGPFPPIAAERIQWYESGAFLLFMVGSSSLLFITVMISAVRHRRLDRAAPSSLRWARAVLACGGMLLLVFHIGLALVLGAGFEQLASALPASLYVVLGLPLLALPLIAGAVLFTVRLWVSAAWSLGARVHYTLAVFAAVALLVVLNYWNLVGYHLG